MNSRSKQDVSVLLAGGLVIVAGLAIIALIWFSWNQLNKDDAAQQPVATDTNEPLPTATNVASQPQGTLPMPQLQITHNSPEPAPTEPPAPAATDVPPTAEPEPTAVPTEPPPSDPMLTAGTDGVNVRTGPGTNYDRLGYLSPGAEVGVTGKYGSWWQINYNGRSGWVWAQIVTTTNVENVPQVSPPPAPTAVPTAIPTAVPATATPVPALDTRGIVVDAFWIEGAPGPFAANSQIWFNWKVRNTSGMEQTYKIMGAWVQETGFHKGSWTDSTYKVGQSQEWRDWLPIGSPGTYHLYLRLCFSDGYCVNLSGPITVNIQ